MNTINSTQLNTNSYASVNNQSTVSKSNSNEVKTANEQSQQKLPAPSEDVIVKFSSQAQALNAKESSEIKPLTPTVPTTDSSDPEIVAVADESTSIRANPKAQAYAQYKRDTVQMNEAQLLLNTQTDLNANQPKGVDDFITPSNMLNKSSVSMSDYLTNNPDAREPALEIAQANNEQKLTNSYLV